MYRQEQINAIDTRSVQLTPVLSIGVPSLPRGNNNPQQVRPQGDPASVHSSLYQVPAGYYERHASAFE